MQPTLAFFSPGPMEMLIFGVIALLLFGKRLPEVARSLGKGIVEFKKGVKGIEDDVDQNTYYNKNNERSNTARPAPVDQQPEMTAPKFQPPSSEPRPTDNQV